MDRRLLLLACWVAVAGVIAAPAGAAIPQLPNAELVSIRHDAALPAGAREISLAGGGRFAAFSSDATGLVAGQAAVDTNGSCDVFRRDLLTGETVLVSRLPGGGQIGSDCSRTPRISSEGTVVAFASSAANLITAAGGGASPPAGVEQVLVADLAAGTLKLASRADGAAGAPAAAPSGGGAADFALSGDGKHVAFVSPDALAPGVPAAGDQLWQRDLAAATTVLASAQHGSATAPLSESARNPSLDQYGLRVAFMTSGLQVLVREPGNVTTLASQTTGGALIDGARPALSATGRAVAFTTRAPTFSPSFTQQVVLRDLAAATTSLVSRPAGGSTPANQDAGPPSISGQGRVVAFASAATNLGAGDPDGHAQVYVADLRRSLLTLASPSASGNGSGAGGDSSSAGEGTLLAPSLAQDGITVGYTSQAADLIAADADSERDAVLRRVRNVITPPPGSTRELSLGGLDGRNVGQQRLSGGSVQGEGITDSALSSSGRYAGFVAGADRFAGDPRPTGAADTVSYVRDRLTGEVEAISRHSDSGGRPGALMTAYCSAQSMLSLSASGRYVTFCSGSGVYRRDRELGITTRVDVGLGGAEASGGAQLAGISANGRFVAFGSTASNLVAGTPSTGLPRLYLRDLTAGTTVRVDLGDGLTDPSGGSSSGPRYSKPSVSDDGRLVAFEYSDGTLVPGTGIETGYPQAYVRDLTTNRTHLLNRAENGSYGRYGVSATGQTQSTAPQLTPDGRYVVFTSDAGNLIAGKTNTSRGVYRQRLTFGGAGGAIDGPLELVSVPHAAGGTQLDGAADLPAISADGQRVAFVGTATNIVSGVLGYQVYARDLPAGASVLVSREDGAGGAPAGSGQIVYAPGVSADGSVISFDTRAGNLDGDTSVQSKLMARTLAPTAGTLAPVNSVLPSVSPAAPRAGEPASCSTGSWSGTPSLTYAWLLDGVAVAGEETASFVPPLSAHLKELRCRVTATNAAGSASATSGPRTVTLAPPAVRVTGAAVFAQTVSCDAGRWSGDPSLTIAWLRAASSTTISGGGGSPAGSGPTLELEDPDVHQWIGCRATITEGGGSVSVTSNPEFVRAEVTIVRPPEPLTPPREGEAFTCSDTELRVRPSGLGVTHSYVTRYLRANGEIALDTPPSPFPATQGPLGTGTAGTQLACFDEGRIDGQTSFRADGPLVTVAARAAAPPPPAPATPAELPRPTTVPQIAFARELERFCRPPTYDPAPGALRSSFRWTYHYAGGREAPVPAAELKAGLLGDGQVFTGVAAFGPYSAAQPIGVSCSHVLIDGARERVTRSAVVRPQITCTRIGKQGGGPGPDGIPFAVTSMWCEAWADDGAASVVADAPPLPVSPLRALIAGTSVSTSFAVGCGAAVTATSGCTFAVTLYAVRATRATRLQGAAPVVTTAARRGAKLGSVRGRVRKGQRAAKVRLRLSGAAAKSLRRGRSVQTLLVIRHGRGKAQVIAAPVLSRKRR